VLRDARSVMNGFPLPQSICRPSISARTHHDARTTMHPPPLDLSAPGEGHASGGECTGFRAEQRRMSPSSSRIRNHHARIVHHASDYGETYSWIET
jgi:hypothetical protein